MNKLIYYINNNLDIAEEYANIFGKRIPQSKMFCPFHHNTDTPAAKRYGNIIKCFSCNKAYSVYDLLLKYAPERIKQVKETVIIEEEVIYSKSVKLINLDRSLPLPTLIKTIFEHYRL